MNFAHPQMLWLLLVLPPAMLAFFYWSGRKRRQLMTGFIESRLLPGLLLGVSPARAKLGQGLYLLALVCLILTLARPQWGFHWEEASLRGLDIVVAIDTSKSMLAEDITPNRLARAKLAALDLMQLAKTDRLGLVAFAGSAFLQCPLTIDDQAFRQSVEALDIGIIPQGGTALAEAIRTTLTAYKEGDNHRILVLFTDGEDHDSKAVEAAQEAAESGLKIFTIGLGTVEGELLRVKDAAGHSQPLRDEQGNQVRSHLNEELLREIAGATQGGFYLPLRGAKTIDTLYNSEYGLSRLPKADHRERLVKQYHERYHWPLALALLLLALETLIPERTRPRRDKEGAGALASLPGRISTGLFLLAIAGSALVSPQPAAASPARALSDFEAGRYQESLKAYEELLKQHKDDPRLHYNAGTAAYRNGQFDQALRQFSDALNTPDLTLLERAYYNRGNTQYYLGEQAPDPSKRGELWRKSIQDFESVLKLNPKDADAEYNRDYVKKRLEELEKDQQKDQKPDDVKPSEAAKKAKALADEAVRQRQYKRALEIMEKSLSEDATTQAYEQFMQHLREVINVQESAATNAI